MASTAVKSASTHQCSYGILDGDDGCLYTAFRSVNGTLGSSTNEKVQHLVADYLFRREITESQRSKIEAKYKSLKECFNEIKKGSLYGGKNELHALARISRLVIRVLSSKKSAQSNIDVQTSEYGEDQSSVKQCVYIFYDGEKKHYAPLYCIDEKSSETLAIFQRDDLIVLDGFVQFIRSKF